MECPNCKAETNECHDGRCVHCSENQSRHPLGPGDGLGDEHQVEELRSDSGGTYSYLVRNIRLGYLCSARVFTGEWCSKTEVSTAIKSCAIAQSRVAHSSVLGVRDVFETEHGELTVVTDYVDGPTASVYLDSQGRLLEEEATEILKQVLSALSACHNRGLHHLGLRPECVWLQQDEQDRMQVYVDAFGFSRHLPLDETHWAPEQHEGAATDERTDLYACGLLLYELLAGVLPPEDVRNLRATLPTLSLTTERVILRALSPNPEDRFQSAEEMRNALASDEGILTSMQALPLSSPAQTKPRSSRNVVWIVALAVAMVTIGYLSNLLSNDEGEGTVEGIFEPLSSQLPSTTAPRVASQRPPIPEVSALSPLPVELLPKLGSQPALADVVFVIDLDRVLPALPAIHLSEPLSIRYGDNLRLGFLLVTGDTEGAHLRAKAALAAGMQGAFLEFARVLALDPGLVDSETLLASAEALGLDVAQFSDDLLSDYCELVLQHHAALAGMLDVVGDGEVLLNGRGVKFTVGEDALPTSARLARVIDGELDEVQRLLMAGVAPENVALLRTATQLAPRRWLGLRAPINGSPPLMARRIKPSSDGLPSLGAFDAPLHLLLYTDPSHEEGLALLETMRAFYQENPELVHLQVKLSPAPMDQRGFDLGIALLSEHAAGQFWNVLDTLDTQPWPTPSRTAADELFRSRIVAQSQEGNLLDGNKNTLLANGRLIHGDEATFESGMREELELVKLLSDAGLSKDELVGVYDSMSQPWSLPEPESRRFLIANWRSLPRLGPLESKVKIFWKFSLLDPSWRPTLRALHNLRLEYGEDLSILLVPLPVIYDQDPTLTLFSRWWGRSGAEIEADLTVLDRLAEGLPPDSEGQTSLEELLDRFEVEAARTPTRNFGGVLHTVEALASMWNDGPNPSSTIVVAWRSGLWFEGWDVDGGLAYEPYWEWVRRALRRSP